MAEQRSSQSRRRREQEETADTADQAEKPQAEKVSADTGELLDVIDDLLKEQLGFDKDEEVSAEKLTERARTFIDQNVQKGGQ